MYFIIEYVLYHLEVKSIFEYIYILLILLLCGSLIILNMKNQKYTPIQTQNQPITNRITLGAWRNRYSQFSAFRNNQMTSIPIKEKRQNHESSLNENGKTR